MGIFYGALIGLALAMDAFAVSFSIGLNRRVRLHTKLLFCISFAFFQFLFALIGGVFGILFSKYVASIPSLIGGMVVALVGVMMIKEGKEQGKSIVLLKQRMIIILGCSVSIDALVLGFTTLNSISSYIYLFEITVLIGIITFFLCGLAYFIARYLKRIDFISKYADYIGGIILILFGIKMILL